MKTDSIFHNLFKQLPQSFFELIGISGDTIKGYRFDSFEIKQTAFRIDGLFLPIDSNSDQPLYFVEVQFRYEAKVYANLLAEVGTYLQQNDPSQDWRGVILFENRGHEPSGSKLKPYQDLLDSGRIMRIYLNELGESETDPLGLGIVKLIGSEAGQTVAQAQRLLVQTEREEIEQQTKIDVVNLIKTIVVYKFPQKSREELEVMLDLDDLRKVRAVQEVAREERAEGRLEGRLEGKIETIPRLLRLNLTVEQIADILQLEVEQVRRFMPQQFDRN